MKILVTGGTGYIGSHTIVDLLENGMDVVCVDNGINSDKSVLHAVEEITGRKVTFYPIDLCDNEATRQIFWDEKPDGVIHFAALKSVNDSMNQPLAYFRNNLESLINTLDQALEVGVRAFVFSSSCTVYGNVSQSPVTEDTPQQPAASVYGRTKQMGEHIIQDSLLKRSMKASLLRYFNPAGAHPSGKLGESPLQMAQNLVPVITETAIGKRNTLQVFGTDYPTRDGSCVRDFIHVCDLARAHTLALQYLFSKDSSTGAEIFNLGLGQGVTVLEAINAFEKVNQIKLNYTLADRREGDVVAIYSNYAKAKSLLGWEPVFTIDDIMKTAWQWELNRTNKS